MKIRIAQLAVPLVTALVLVINYFAAIGSINGRDPGYVSDLYSTGITPAGYAFSIWSLIYLGMIGFCVYQFLPSQKENLSIQRVRFWYVALSMANIGWIFAWHYDLIPLSLILILALLVCLLIINIELKTGNSNVSVVLVKFPFGLYFGWVTVAAVLNAAITLVYLGVGVSERFSTIAGSLVVVGVTVAGSILRFKLNSVAYPLAIAWAVTAIAVKQSGSTLLVVTCAFAMMTLLFFALWGYIKDR